MTIKNYIQLGILLVVVALSITVKTLLTQNKKLKEAKAIQIENVKELLAENSRRTELILNLQLAKRITSLKLDSLSKALQIKPKTIIKTVEHTVIQNDTIIKEVPVQIIGKNTWRISDQNKCFSWYGIAKLQNDSLEVTRTGFDYKNKATEIYYSIRTKKFLCIKYGKKKTFVKSSSECGESFEREILIQKN